MSGSSQKPDVGGLAYHLLIDVGYLILDVDRSGPTTQRSSTSNRTSTSSI
jgi:hypothetical protein